MFFLIDWLTRLLYGSEAVENFNRKQRQPKARRNRRRS